MNKHLNPEALEELNRIKKERQEREQESGATRSGLDEWDAGDDTELPPPRGWLLGNILCRGFMSSLLADGGVGKTALRTAQLLSLATGRSFTGDHVFQRCRVLMVSLEDDAQEIRRRVLAAMLHHRIELEEVKGWLFLATPGASVGKLMTLDQRGHLVRGALVQHLEHAIIAREIDIISLDPFVKTHSVEENNNSAIDDVVQVLTDLSAKYKIAVDVPHHTSKGPADPGNASRARGASAMNNGGRLVYTLTTMNPEEAEAFAISEDDRKSYIRMDSGKVNITRPLGAAKWFHLVSVPLGNATDMYPNGDEVQTVELWKPPDTWSDLSIDLLNRILTAIDAGLPNGNRYSDAPNVIDRAAWKVVVDHAPNKTEVQAREIIKIWVKNRVLVRDEYENRATRKPVKGLRVDPVKRPS
jgi:AAA domain